MRDAGHRPFLRERVEPVAPARGARKRLDMLYDTRILVVCLFDEEAVVLDLRLALGRSLRLERQCDADQYPDESDRQSSHIRCTLQYQISDFPRCGETWRWSSGILFCT